MSSFNSWYYQTENEKNGTPIEQAFESIQNTFTAKTISSENVHGYSLPSVIHCINQKQSLNHQVSLYGYALKVMLGNITVEDAVEDIYSKALKMKII